VGVLGVEQLAAHLFAVHPHGELVHGGPCGHREQIRGFEIAVGLWLRKVCSTVVIATCSSMVTTTLWLTIAKGGSFLSSGISNPAAEAEPAVANATTNTGRAYRRNRMANLNQQRTMRTARPQPTRLSL